MEDRNPYVSQKKALLKILAGDCFAMNDIRTVPHEILLSAASSMQSSLVLKKEVVASVLDRLDREEVHPNQAHEWASFVRRGYVAGPSSEPILPLRIIYEQQFEDLIVEAITRLDELGDLVDGSIGKMELKRLISSLC